MAQTSSLQPCPSTSPPPQLLHTAEKSASKITTRQHPVHKTLATAANLANLLPTGTVLAFRALTPSFSNKGSCHSSNKYLTASLIAFCAAMSFLSSFTDSFIGFDGRLYYGIATFKGFYIFNHGVDHDDGEGKRLDLSKCRISFIDFVHAFVSLLVFLVFAISDANVASCFFPHAGGDVSVLEMNLPLGAGVFSSFLFMLFPTTRRGIGCADTPSLPK